MILGLSGKAKSGKTTAAVYLENDRGFVRRSFAALLRSYVAKLFGCSERQLVESAFKEQKSGVGDLTWRDLMKRTGAFLRSMDPLFFVDRIDLSGKLVVVDDVRFINEAKKIEGPDATQGILIRLRRPQTETGDDDISETELDNWDFVYTVDNSGDFQQLFNRIDEILIDLGVLKGVRNE